MIEHLTGFPTVVMPAKVILNVAGVGYGLEVPTPVLATLAENPDREVSLWVYTYVKEDALKLYGFASYGDRRMFELLIGISGVGPKVALGVLSTLSTDLIADGAQSEESKIFEQVPGVGARLAKKLIVELKPKLQKEMEFKGVMAGSLAVPETKTKKTAGEAGPAALMTELVSALENMGYPAKEVRDVTVNLDLTSGKSLEVLLREAFQLIGQHNSGTKKYDRRDESTLPF